MAQTAPLRFDVPADVAFGYLVDPRNRPEWQPSLRRVELLDGEEPRVGQRWLDHTAAGVVARMETTALEPGVLWTEIGRWRAIEAELTLRFAPHREGCTVDAEFEIRGRGALRPLAWVLGHVALPAVRGDLRRAHRILGARTPG